MKKLFFAICFNICLFGLSQARITPISGYTNITQEIIGDKEDSVKIVDQDEFAEFLSNRFKTARKARKEEINKSVSVLESEASIKQKQEEEKNFFQKAYEKAIKRISEQSDEDREDITEDDFAEMENQLQEDITEEIEKQTSEWKQSPLPMVTTLLPPDNIPVDVPAIEHIPYLKNNIEILSNGMVKFEETIVVVANGQKLKSGLTKILPSKIFAKDGKSKNIDYSIISVSINDTPVDYKLAKSGNRVLMVPYNEYRLPAGIYTYKFQYLADNLLSNNGDSYNFYWNIGGNGLNLIVDRAFANLTTPAKGSTIRHGAIIGSARGFYPNSVTDDENGITFTYKSQIPIFIGTGMHIMVDVDKTAFYSETLSQKIIRSFYDYGDIYISFIGLCIIAISFAISWSYVSKLKSRVKISLNKTSLVARYLLREIFDKKSICGFFLDLYKKNIIDIQQSGETILLIKSTDNMKSLLGYEKRALKSIFPSHETTFSITKTNQLPLKRFAKKIEKGLKRDILKFKLKLNAAYLLLNIAIMAVVWAGIAMFKIDSFYTFGVIATTTLFCFLGSSLWYLGHKKWQKIISRYLSINIMVLCWIIYSAVVHPLGALFLTWCVILVTYSIKLYSSRNGLLKPYIQDIIKQKEYLVDNKDVITLSKGFEKHQAFVFVCDLEKEIKPSKNDGKYKIPVIENIMKRL